MTNLLDTGSPARPEAASAKSDFGLVNHGLRNLGTVYWNLPAAALIEEALHRREGRLSQHGALVCATGQHTGLATADRFIVREAGSEQHVWWGEHNRPFDPGSFTVLLGRLQGYLQGRDLYVQDCRVGADPCHTIPIRVITEKAWHSLFARNLFLEIEPPEAPQRFVPQFTIIHAPGFAAVPEIDNTASATCIVLNFAQRLGLICGTGYAGEIKRSVFTVMNHLMPLERVLSMRCAANVGAQGDVALFFGQSGSGKTALSADPKRRLLGDDEHGWSDEGVFAYEGGRHAKLRDLSPAAVPMLHACTRRFGTILENAVLDPRTRALDLTDARLAGNARASFPLELVGDAGPRRRAGHPKSIVMLTCDASGVLPPIARLRPDQALYHFVSGYSAGADGAADMDREPEASFSACFGAPFLVHRPGVYAGLLKGRIERHGVRCWLLNTGWFGGPYGSGRRVGLQHSRALLAAALDDRLDGVPWRKDPVFGFEIPTACPDVPADLLAPANGWKDATAWEERSRALAASFIENFKRFAPELPPGLELGGPHRG